jgi:ABC-2 type transport system permease protein
MTAARVADRSVEAKPRFPDLLRAEWIKLWSLRSTYLALGLGALAMIGLAVNAAAADYSNWPTYSASFRGQFIPIQDAFGGPPHLLLIVAAGTIGAITIVSEYASGLIRTTFAAVPARRSVVAAKVVVVSSVMAVVGVFVEATSFWLTQAILSGRHAGWSIGHPEALRALVASALLAPVCALVGMGLGALIRHTATTVVAVIVGLALLPDFFLSIRHRWVVDVHSALPLEAWRRLTSPFALPPSRHWPTVTGSWVVFALWPIAAVIAAVIAVQHRDV